MRMKIEFETDEMTVEEMRGVRRLLKTLMIEAIDYKRKEGLYDDPVDMTLDFPKKGDKK